MTHTKKAVIFDLDGTLINNRASFAKAYQAICETYPGLFDPKSAKTEQLMVDFYRSAFSQEAYERLAKSILPQALPKLEVLRMEWGMAYASNAVTLPGARETIAYLRNRGYKVGLLTNGNSARQWAKIYSSGLFTCFDSIVVSGDQPFEKPDPAIYRLSLSELDVTAEEALFVGNTVETDIDGANNAGMDSLWLTKQKENTAGATYLAEDVTFLTRIL